MSAASQSPGPAEGSPRDDAACLPGGATDQALTGLRVEIDAIDHQLVDLLAQRQQKVRQVVTIKQAQRLPVYHPAREENLVSERREQARAAGLDPDHVEELYRCILRNSRSKQAAHLGTRGIRAGATVLLVGGDGKMGRLFARWFGEAGYQLRVLEVDDWARADELCQGIDLALVTVPIGLTSSVILDLGPKLPERCVLADITSIKQAPVAAMLQAHRGPVIGLHPLFGPMTTSMDKQIVVATPGRFPEDSQWLMDQFFAWGNIVLTIAPEEHDEIMAIIQALRHFATFAFGHFLSGQQASLARTLEFSSPIYRLELGMVGRFFAQDAALYADIIFASPERRALLGSFLDSLASHRDLVEKGDKAAFCDQFDRIARWFGPFSDQAMRESGFLINKLVEHF